MAKILAVLLLLLLLIRPGYIFAQCTNGNQPECACETAPVLCTVDELDGYQFSMTSFQHPQDGPSPICPGAFMSQSNNPTWFAFTAWCEDLTLRVSSNNCVQVQNFIGFQIAIYSDCNFTNVVDCNADPDDCNTNTKILNLNGLVIGEVYYFLVDGCLGSYCDVTIDVVGVCGQEVIEPWTLPVTGDLHPCAGQLEQYAVQSLDGAATYHWFLEGALVQASSSTSFETVWTTAGTYELCIDVSHDPCVPITNDPAPLCVTIVVEDPYAGILNVVPTLLCVSENAGLSVTGYAQGSDLNQILFITDQAGNIIWIGNNSFASDTSGQFTVYAYNYVQGSGPVPFIGMNIQDIDCSLMCCDLISESLVFQGLQTEVNDVVCNNNGTDNDPTDDFFTFNLLVIGPHPEDAWISEDGELFGQFGVPYSCGFRFTK